MLKKLRLRFTLITALVVLIITIAPISVLNFVSHWESGRETSVLLRLINFHKGMLPAESVDGESEHYQYFSVYRSSSGEVSVTSKRNLDNVSDTQISSAAETLLDSLSTAGTVIIADQSFSYQVVSESDGLRLSAVNINAQLANRSRLFHISIAMFLVALFFFISVAAIISKWAVQPFVENYKKQKRFIANAGHELKTPLAIISANTELQEMMEGESEWSASTKAQVERMTALINQMVSLARLEEQPDVTLGDVNFSETVQNAASSFKSSIMRDGKTFHMDVAEGINIKAEAKSAFELVNILVDNANKYCDDGGNVSVLLRKSRDPRYSAHLEVANTYMDGKGKNYSHFFERFYRDDESHTRAGSSESEKTTSGFGIGLNMAQSMVKLFKGRIDVRYSEDTIIFVVRL
ncbi:HAMP domain-containing sensor histidine kinase [Alloscardovia omnicolens]|uniref:Sensor-like histidine kinase SenX3 n=2 Tax=Alloscardovia omnicolens TaxID=419015 RepID=U1SLU6_9BIFI|nr:HAMP domain-containing sensor histidine kinase [Alloscardovia omnicolens]ERH31657.1 histidine kinase A domain protein [Alloscardovia omnicolens F0580]KWZ72778.1 histidine kinase A domain protein [Alloscardovia omnicolens]MBS6345943.1 HAMP domain-containing histidine kinase [Alloscardovia omnicolens]MDK6250027.1 HAMP domain-containing sensor histidine kinase [Alloscardovia omnicolens]MDK6251363.1 HAMP domain-containing sensor histidine kinase [Alloscardovia omnicolens]